MFDRSKGHNSVNCRLEVFEFFLCFLYGTSTISLGGNPSRILLGYTSILSLPSLIY